MKTTIRSTLLIALTTGLFTATLPVSFADAALSDNYMHNQTPDVVDAILENGTDQHMFQDTIAYVGKTGPQGPSWRGQPSREADHMINCINNCVTCVKDLISVNSLIFQVLKCCPCWRKQII